jgi:hypothetical protein
MLGRVGLSLGLALVLCGGTARADGDASVEVLKRFFPDRDFTSAPIKMVNPGVWYAAGHTFQILTDGRVQITNAAVVLVEQGRPHEAPSYSRAQGGRLVLKFQKPVKQLADVRGNPLVSVEVGQ